MSPWLRLPLRLKWSLALLLAGTLPLGLLAYVTIDIQRAGLARAEQDLEVAAVDGVSHVIASQLDAAAEVAHRAGQVLTDGRIREDDVRLALATDAVARAGALEYLAIFSAKGEYIDTLARGDTGKAAAAADDVAKHRLDVATLSPAAGAWLPVAFGPRGPSIDYVEPMRGDDAVRGWVLVSLAVPELDAAIVELARARFNDPERISVVDDRLRVVLGAPFAGAAPGATIPASGLFATSVIPLDAFARPFGFTTEFTDASGTRMVGTVRTLPETRWIVAVRRPEAEAYRELAAARRAFLGTAGLVALLAVIAGVLFAARTTRPIRHLVDLTRAYGRREFTRASSVHTGDELEELGASLTDMAKSLTASDVEIARRATVEAGLSRYLPEEVAKSIAAGTSRLELGGERRQITVLFADVVAFTTFAESAPPERVVAFLNELFTVLSEVVFRHGGMVDKFMGDCIMAVFGASGERADHAAAAVAAAEDMHRFVQASAPAWKEVYGFDVALGIGLSTGDAIVGNLGSDTRMEYTAIGDAVNVAARLEGLARPGQTLVTAAAARAAGEAFTFHSLGDHPIRGKQKAIEVLELST